MKNYQEYHQVCQSIDQLQWQMFKQGKKHNEFMHRELIHLQNQMRELFLQATGKTKQVKTRPEGNRPGRRDE